MRILKKDIKFHIVTYEESISEEKIKFRAVFLTTQTARHLLLQNEGQIYKCKNQ